MPHWLFTPLVPTSDGPWTKVTVGAEWVNVSGRGMHVGGEPVRVLEDVWGRHQGGFNWYYGTVSAVHKNSKITILYQDGAPRLLSNLPCLPPPTPLDKKGKKNIQ